MSVVISDVGSFPCNFEPVRCVVPMGGQ
jgi:hypothetical protein